MKTRQGKGTTIATVSTDSTASGSVFLLTLPPTIMEGGEWVPPRRSFPLSWSAGWWSQATGLRVSLRISKHEIRTSFVSDHTNQDWLLTWYVKYKRYESISCWYSDIYNLINLYLLWYINAYYTYVLLCGSISNLIQLFHKYVPATDPHLHLACSHCIHRPQSSSACFSASAMAASSFWKVIPMASTEGTVERQQY